jgi:hypothetical protein
MAELVRAITYTSSLPMTAVETADWPTSPNGDLPG